MSSIVASCPWRGLVFHNERSTDSGLLLLWLPPECRIPSSPYCGIIGLPRGGFRAVALASDDARFFRHA
eukprot:4412678-Prorocentrum_lima.AAC.1